MLIRDISRKDLARLLGRGTMHLDTGAFTTRLRCDIPTLVDTFAGAYADYEVETAAAIVDFRVALARRFGVPFRAREARVYINGGATFPPFPESFAFPMLEAGLNWCIAKHVYRYVAFHAAAVERDGRALIMAGPSGSGKSTLCAALALRGWRLLSDELVLVRPDDLAVVANPRPISLKNETIDLLGAFAPEARFDSPHHGTNKGTIAFLRPPPEAAARAKDGASPAIMIAPSFRADGPAELTAMARTESFLWLVENAVNYYATLRVGFDTLAGLVERCRFYRLAYHDLEETVTRLSRLHEAMMAGDEAA